MNPIGQPATPWDVTAEWLSSVLRTSGVGVNGEITDVEIEIIGEEHGFTGVVARLRPEYSGTAENAPKTLVAKFPLAERAVESSYRRTQPQSSGISQAMVERAAREVAFYRAAGSDLPQLPRCYFGHVDVDAGEAILLLEDLSESEQGDALTGCSVDEARSVLTSVRDIHAGWWRDDSLPSLDWLSDWPAANNRRAVRYREQVEAVIQAYGGDLSGQTVDLMRNLAEPFERILSDLSAAPQTLIHADLHLDNVMFLPDGGDVQAKIIDWQSPSRGPAMLDVAGFIAESLAIDDRRSSETELLREYHDGLMDAGIDGYSFERLFDDYLRGLCVRMAGQVGWLARVVDEKPVGREGDLVDALLEPGRIFMALLDHEHEMRERLDLW